MPEASNSGEGSTNGASTRHARLVGELPPQVNLRPEDSNGRPRPQGDDDEEDSNEDDDAGSDFDETTVKGEGGLAAKIVQLDEREFEDKKRRSEKEDGDGEQAGIEELSTNPDADLLADFPADTDEIELTHARLRSLQALHLERFGKAVKRLSLRQNLLTSLLYEDGTAPIEALDEVEEIDLYDNRISKVAGLKGLSKLSSLDLSFNLLRKVPVDQIETMPRLRVLYMIQNKISRIEGLDKVASTLESVEFGGNKLRTIENLELCTRLTELWFGKNKIARLEGMSTLKNLKILSIQSNRITKLEGLEELESLEELYISHNGIKKLEGLDKNHKLRVLDIGNNFIQKVENISHLTELEEFWANNNLIDNFAEVEGQLSTLKTLDTVYLEGNPLQKDMGVNYRRKIMLALPQLSQIDATFVQQR